MQRRKDEEDDDGDDDGDEGEDDDEDSRNDNNERLTARSIGTHLLGKRQTQWPWNRGGMGSDNKNRPAPATLQPGFLTAILLNTQASPTGGYSSAQNQVVAGYPLQVLLQVATSTSGGKSNSISPAQWHPEYLALADSEKGLVQVWRFDGVGGLPRGSASLPAQRPPYAQPEPWVQSGGSGQGRAQPQPYQQQSYQPQPYAQPNGQPKSKGRPPPNPLNNGGIWTNPYAEPQLGRPERSQYAKRQQDYDIRASIVAEWKAPSEAIGQGDPDAPRSQTEGIDDKKGKVPKWGRGCCANALWYD